MGKSAKLTRGGNKRRVNTGRNAALKSPTADHKGEKKRKHDEQLQQLQPQLPQTKEAMEKVLLLRQRQAQNAVKMIPLASSSDPPTSIPTVTARTS